VPQLRPVELGELEELRAVGCKLVIAPEEPPARLLEIVRKDEDTFAIGRVISMGIEAADKLREVKPGDRVLYSQSVSATNAAAKREGSKLAARHVVHHDHVLCGVAEDVQQWEARPCLANAK
jgi:hypothetical protein